MALLLLFQFFLLITKKKKKIAIRITCLNLCNLLANKAKLNYVNVDPEKTNLWLVNLYFIRSLCRFFVFFCAIWDFPPLEH